MGRTRATGGPAWYEVETPLSLFARNHNNMRNREGFQLSKRKHAGTSWVRIVVAAAVAGSAFALTGSSYAAEKTPVRIGVTNASSDVAFHIGDDRGFFAEEGLAPEYIPFKSATDMVAPLATGQLDVGGGGASAALYNAAARGLELRIVADKGSMPAGYGYMLLVVRKDLVDSGKVKSFADLKGLKIGNSSSGGSGDALLNAALIKGGLKFSDVTRVYMSFPQLGVAFKNRAIDAAFLTEPNASEPVKAGDAVKFARGDEIYPDQALAVILYGPLLLKKRDIGQRFMNAYLCGPSPFMDVARVVASEHWPSESIHREYFAADAQVVVAPGQDFEVTLARSGGTYRVPPDKTIIEVLAQHGIAVDVSCEQGVCGTCLTGVLGGTPDHRDAFLTEDEKRSGLKMLPCVSRAESERLVLDL